LRRTPVIAIPPMVFLRAGEAISLVTAQIQKKL
jgi:hypothetical protein